MASIPAWAHYRKADVPAVACSTCDFFRGEDHFCTMFQAPVARDMVCDRWAYRIEKRDVQPGLSGGTDRPPLSAKDKAQFSELLGALEPEPRVAKADGVTAAGIAVRAKDTGRVLMIQRHNDPKDPAGGTWEFPGGCLEEGEHPLLGARREWQEEMGTRLPRGHYVGSWRSGIYQGFVHEVPSESSVPVNLDHEDRRVLNPDDPDGDQVEVAAWWAPDHLRYMKALRPELRDARPWQKVAKAAGALYLVSHAKTRYNRPGQPHDIVHGWRDTPLDAGGQTEARKLARFFKRVGVDEVHASDLKRAKQTAEMIASQSGAPLAASGKYRPWNLGSFAGHSSADVIPKLKPYMGAKSDQPVDGGESFDTFKNRFLPALEALLKKAEAGHVVVLVTHSRNIELAQGWVGGRFPREKLDTSAISADRIDPAVVFRADQGKNGGWRLTELADETVQKAQARPATLHLRVHGVSAMPDGQRVYRLETRDGRYVGRSNPTRVRARKGDAVKVEANDFLQDTQGDLRWMNANVVSGYKDAPHSWRDLLALAGGTTMKEAAPGPAGDLPPANDMGASSSLPSGPTLDAVHVPAPLPDISVAYMPGKRAKQPVLRGEFLPVQKADQWKQLVYGVVLEPHVLDSQDDFMLPHHVESAAHNYLKKAIRGRSSVAKLQHRRQGFQKDRRSLVPVESFIAPTDFSYDGKETIKKGTWVMVMHVEDPNLWQDILDGKYTGFSVGGSGIRQSVHDADQMIQPGLIGPMQPNYFEPDPRRLAATAGG